MIDWARTLAYRIAFYGGSVPIVLAAPVSALFGQRAMIDYALGWTRFQRWCARALGGIASRVEGVPIAGPALYAAKHQAMYETTELPLLLDGPAIVMKRELAQIPVFGWVTRRYGVIVVDRDGSSATLRQMLREAKRAIANGRSILIFPEGTRVAPGDAPPLKSGFAGLYRMLGLPVVPVALDSGSRMPRKGPMRPGDITIRFGAPIPPGLPREEIEARVHAAINALETAA